MEELKRELEKIASGEIQDLEQAREILRRADQENKRLENEFYSFRSMIYRAEQSLSRGVGYESA